MDLLPIRVDRGARFLDGYRPGWHDEVDPDKLGTAPVGAGKALARMSAEEQGQALQDAEESGGKVTPAKVRKAREKTGQAVAVPLTLKQVRQFWVNRSPVSEIEKRFNTMMVAFLDGDVTTDNMDSYLSDFHENYRGDSLDQAEDSA